MNEIPLQRSVSEQIERIQAEMERIGMWQAAPLEPSQLSFREAFAIDTMSFGQWLQFVLIPRVREAVEDNEFPEGSEVAVQAVREFDGYAEADSLIALLSELDGLFS